jgi:hypothetical protein
VNRQFRKTHPACNTTFLEINVAQSSITSHTIAVEHIKIESGKRFEEVRRALEETIPKLNPAVGEFLRKSSPSAWRLISGGPYELAKSAQYRVACISQNFNDRRTPPMLFMYLLSSAVAWGFGANIVRDLIRDAPSEHVGWTLEIADGNRAVAHDPIQT